MLIERSNSLLLVVDIQSRLMPAIHQAEMVELGAVILLDAAARLGVPRLISEQYPKGLGPTVPVVANAAGDVVPLPKIAFSCAADPGIAAAIRAAGRQQIVLAGAEAHVCVLQSALGFKAEGYDVVIVADATSSRRPESKAVALRRAVQAGIVVATVEMVLFEWLGAAGTEEFRAISRLIK
jgi:nicotinamidase-related amidase